ncbi:MAG: tetratricopeptide repeat protein, partial [Planctomycetota bacterium]
MPALCGAIENPNVGSPFKARNAPTQSGQQQRYITRGNPYGKSGNDIVTGNVGGGKHFRGVVPYGSSYYSGAYSNSRGSRSVNNFIRRSSDPIVNDRNPGQINTYYDPRRTVSSMRRSDGSTGLSNPQLTGQGRGTNPYIMPTPARTIMSPEYQRPLSANNMDLEQILTRREQLRQDAEKETEGSEDIKGFFDETLSLEQMEQNQEDEETPALEEDALTKLLKESQEIDDEQELEPESDEATKTETGDETKLFDRTRPKRASVQTEDIEALAEKGREVLGEHETFASLADEKFDGFMNAAEEFIRNGQFYKAADTYALAIIWKPEDARGYLGQSFSLFAAGEYMSSAYYLGRAFELNPKAATKKYNL